MAKPQDNKRKIDAAVAIVAEMFGVTLSYVRMIRDGKRNNKEIRITYDKIKNETGAIVKSVKASIKVKK